MAETMKYGLMLSTLGVALFLLGVNTAYIGWLKEAKELNVAEKLPSMFLSKLREGCPALTSDVGGAMAEAASVCLEDRGHQIKVELRVEGEHNRTYTLHRVPTTEQMRRCHNDLQDATELGAYGIAILTIEELTHLTIVERSRKGTGFDYWLGDEDERPFQNKARLEVSGILQGEQSVIDARVKQKIEQTTRSDRTKLPSYVAIIEYSQPVIRVVKRVVQT